MINYNISYLYIAGLKTDEANILSPAPIWGDETDSYDVGTLACVTNALEDAARVVRVRRVGLRSRQILAGGVHPVAGVHAKLVHSRSLLRRPPARGNQA